MPYARPNIQKLAPYVPGEQPATSRVVKLNTNENPYPPAPAVLEAIRQIDGEALRRYPPPRAERFRTLAADIHGLQPDQVIATNGGDELLRLAVTVFASPAATAGVASTQPTYSLYGVLAAIQDAAYASLPLTEDFDIPADLGKQLNDAKASLALLVNPHAPSGRLFGIDQLERVAHEFRGVLLIDEAYVNFAQTDALDLIRGPRSLPNVVLLRSLSKGYSLAGLRFGYGLGHADLIAAMDKARDSYNTNVLAQAGAIAALQSRDYAADTWRKVITERSRLSAALTELGYFVYPSQTNFLMVIPPSNDALARLAGDAKRPASPPAGVHSSTKAKQIYESLKQNGIFVRYFDLDALRDKLRITIGTPEQNDTLIAALTKI